jgi:hypothetical protein
VRERRSIPIYRRRSRRPHTVAGSGPATWLLSTLIVLIAAACSGPPHDRVVPAPGQTRSFEGTWSATGTRRALELEPGHRASIFSLSGSLLLTGEGGHSFGFLGDVIGFSDSVTGGGGDCVWTDENGDRIFSRLRGQPIGTGARVTGTITGGTGRWAGVTGEYEFHFQYVIESDDATFSGRAVGLKGRVTVPVTGASRQ